MKQTTMNDAQRPWVHLFMVRVWLEDPGDGKPEWRRQVKYAFSGEVRYFREWANFVKQLKAMVSRVEKNGTL